MKCGDLWRHADAGAANATRIGILLVTLNQTEVSTKH